MRILCWGTFDTGKPRTRILLDGLGLAGATVCRHHANIWQGVRDKSQVRGLWRRLGLAVRWLGAYPRLVWSLAFAPKPDVLLIGFPGVLDVLIAAPIARLRGIPLAWDMFMSLYDTVVEDRKLWRKGSLPARVLHAVEGFAVRRADLVFLDTAAHARRVERLFGLANGHAGSVWVGTETGCFTPRTHAAETTTETVDTPDAETLRILFYGQFIPLHGIETIVQAARITRGDRIQWQLIGTGQEAEKIRAMLDEQPLPNVSWDTWVDYEALPGRIEQAHVCLGIFGCSEKAASVIPNKVFQIVAMGRPLITRDSPAIRELLDDAFPCAQLIPAGDAQALADAARAMLKEGGNQAKLDCHTRIQADITPEAIGLQCMSLLERRLPMEH
ncbi:glycosyltransferase [Oleiagrimonas sp. C23AA]|uniref:glycosyltransferase n=1 Tax=Oleiagrimonas sp. C23AA TaxID=2719047 RepID=UPI00141D8416|nr:glycosyltransferase [Oleiagrimonas sp. C23AA]NII12130.1 glycosyltransferase family 4 protein [Oleiagrimonas sp. C23AA]